MKTTPAVLAIGMLAAAWPSVASAGGIELGDQNPAAAGRAGAFTAKADDPSAIDYNPGALSLLRGTHVLVANRMIFGNEKYERAPTWDWSNATYGVPTYVPFAAVKNQTPNQYLGPMIAISTDFGLKDWGFAIGVYAPPGTMAQQFPLDGPQKYMLVSRSVEILYYNASVAWKYKNLFGIGATLQWVDMESIDFNLVIDGNTTPRLVSPVSSRFDILSKLSGADHVNATAILGMWYHPFANLEFAASARVVPVWFHAKSHMSIQALNLKLAQPPTLTRDGKPDDTVTFSFLLPPKLRVGGRYVFTRGGVTLGDLEVDLGYEAWSMLQNFTLDGTGLTSTVLGQSVPIGKITMPRHWKDTFSVRAGGDWNVLPGHVTLRGGFYYETNATPDAYAYIDILPGQRMGPSAGFSLDWFGMDLSASYSYIFALPVTVTESQSAVFQQTPGSPCKPPYTDTNNCSSYYVGKPSAPANAGVYVSSYHLVSVALGYKF